MDNKDSRPETYKPSGRRPYPGEEQASPERIKWMEELFGTTIEEMEAEQERYRQMSDEERMAYLIREEEEYTASGGWEEAMMHPCIIPELCAPRPWQKQKGKDKAKEKNQDKPEA